ncbi:cytochrome c oxidase subunit I [Guptibacillus sedimenti]|uniref:cytochrome c oxidase subunit I n=1 Tax=Guptibacillus sedimenti TaxID=3025680 RepID=UPI00235F2C8C|nr:cytochrome c oxidase subunit I [Pseudalkalibacillus sedimenti]
MNAISDYLLSLPSDIIFADISFTIMLIASVYFLTKYAKWKWLWSWITSTDHKKIGIMYLFVSFLFFIRAGIEALLIRMQLAFPNNEFWVFQGERFNQLTSTHGTVMIFLVATPLLIGLMNVIVPLQIGARDVAFPFMNSLSLWLFISGGILINASFVAGGSPNAGWTTYAPLALKEFTPGPGNSYYPIGLQVAGLGTIMGGINFIVTIIKMRAPGMRFMRMPLSTWSMFITSILIVYAFSALAVALLLLTFERLFGTVILSASEGNPLIWQHLFWIFGHPEVYIIALPAFGIFSDVISVFSKRKLFGYPSMVFAIILIGFLGFMVWVHHMFTVGLNTNITIFFALTTMLIAVPTGIKIFNWLFTMRGGRIRFDTPMLYALGFIFTFVIGGVTGVMLGTVPADYQYHDSYFVVAHLHYVIIGATIFGVFSGVYYWWPKMFGKKLNETLGKWNFWTFGIGFHITFFPMHVMGLMGMPRRVFTYPEGDGLGFLNFISTCGAFMMGIGVLFFMINIYITTRYTNKRVLNDPWFSRGRTLEWTIPSPPPAYNFARLPEVKSREPLWDAYENGNKNIDFIGEYEDIHLPNSTSLPFFIGIGFLIASFGFVFEIWPVALSGMLIVFLMMSIRSFQQKNGIHLPKEKVRVQDMRGED